MTSQAQAILPADLNVPNLNVPNACAGRKTRKSRDQESWTCGLKIHWQRLKAWLCVQTLVLRMFPAKVAYPRPLDPARFGRLYRDSETIASHRVPKSSVSRTCVSPLFQATPCMVKLCDRKVPQCSMRRSPIRTARRYCAVHQDLCSPELPDVASITERRLSAQSRAIVYTEQIRCTERGPGFAQIILEHYRHRFAVAA